MADIASWSPVDESNTAAPPDGWPENMQPSAVNNCARAMQGAVRRWYDTVTAQLASITTSLAGYLPLSGGTVTGNLTVNGALVGANPISTTGPNAAYSFADRTGGGSWLWYATGNVARLWAGADKVTIDTGGNIVAGGNINGQTITGSSQLNSNGNINANGTIAASLDVVAYRNMSAAGTAYAGGVDCSGRINAAYYDCDGARVIDTGSSATVFYKWGNVAAITLQNAGSYYDNNVHIFRNSSTANTFSIDAGGNVNATAQVQGASLYSRGNIDAVGTVSAAAVNATGSISANGVISGTRLQGGPGNAGALWMYGAGHSIVFRYEVSGTGQVAYRIDDSLEKYIGSTVNFLDSQYAYPGGGPTNAVLGGHDFPGTWYYSFIDYVSDERIKTNIAPSRVDALAVLQQVPVVEFDVRPEVTEIFRSLRMHGREAPASSGHVPIGLVAQKLQALIPEAVYVGPQPGDNALPEDCHNITLPAITPYLIRAVQQLAARLEALEGQTRTTER